MLAYRPSVSYDRAMTQLRGDLYDITEVRSEPVEPPVEAVVLDRTVNDVHHRAVITVDGQLALGEPLTDGAHPSRIDHSRGCMCFHDLDRGALLQWLHAAIRMLEQ